MNLLAFLISQEINLNLKGNPKRQRWIILTSLCAGSVNCAPHPFMGHSYMVDLGITGPALALAPLPPSFPTLPIDHPISGNPTTWVPRLFRSLEGTWVNVSKGGPKSRGFNSWFGGGRTRPPQNSWSGQYLRPMVRWGVDIMNLIWILKRESEVDVRGVDSWERRKPQRGSV